MLTHGPVTRSNRHQVMPPRPLSSSTLPPAPELSDAEWRHVQQVLRLVRDSATPRTGCHDGAWRRGLARIGQIVPSLRQSRPPRVAPEVQSLYNFLQESARNGPALDELASQLEQHGFSPAQIAAMVLIAG